MLVVYCFNQTRDRVGNVRNAISNRASVNHFLPRQYPFCILPLCLPLSTTCPFNNFHHLESNTNSCSPTTNTVTQGRTRFCIAHGGRHCCIHPVLRKVCNHRQVLNLLSMEWFHRRNFWTGANIASKTSPAAPLLSTTNKNTAMRAPTFQHQTPQSDSQHPSPQRNHHPRHVALPNLADTKEYRRSFHQEMKRI